MTNLPINVRIAAQHIAHEFVALDDMQASPKATDKVFAKISDCRSAIVNRISGIFGSFDDQYDEAATAFALKYKGQIEADRLEKAQNMKRK